MGIFSKINFGLTKTQNKMAGAIDDLLDSVGEINDDLYTCLLYTSRNFSATELCTETRL